MPDNLPDMIAEVERLRDLATIDPQNTRRWFRYHSHTQHTFWPLIAAYRAAIAALDSSHAERDRLAAELAAAKATVADIHTAVARELQPNSGIHLPGEGEQLARRVLEIIERGA